MHREGLQGGYGSKESAAAHEMSQTLAKYKPGPGGGAALPMVNTEGGFSRNPVQNVQARMDAKAVAAPKKSIWGTPKPTLKPKDLQIRSGQNMDPNMAVKSGAGPSAPGRPTPTPALMEALHGAAKAWSGTPIPPDKVEAAAQYMRGKAGVDILKMSEATGLSHGAAKHLNEARKAHFSANNATAPQTSAQRSEAYLKQRPIGLIKK